MEPASSDRTAPLRAACHHVVELARALRVVGERGEVVAVGVAQRVERGLVQAPALAPEQVGLDGFAELTRVTEREHVRFGLDEQAARDEVAQDRDELVLAVARHRREHVEADAGDPEHGRGLEDAPLLRGSGRRAGCARARRGSTGAPGS